VGPKTLANPRPTGVGKRVVQGAKPPWRGVVGGVPPRNQKGGEQPPRNPAPKEWVNYLPYCAFQL